MAGPGALQVEGSSERVEEKRQTMHFREVHHLAFSFKNILKVENLAGLDNLVKLQLDNNVVQKIENLDHLVSVHAQAVPEGMRPPVCCSACPLMQLR